MEFTQTPLAIGNFLKGYEMLAPRVAPNTYTDPLAFLQQTEPQIIEVLEREIAELHGVKFQLGLRILMRKDQISGPPVFSNPTFYHKQVPLLNENEISLQNPFDILLERMENWTQEGSGWIVEHVETLWLNIANYQPLRGGSYIELPTYLKN